MAKEVGVVNSIDVRQLPEDPACFRAEPGPDKRINQSLQAILKLAREVL
jgi:hypothetical protein